MIPRPIALMQSRIEDAKTDGDTAYWMHLLYFGELVTKYITLFFVAGIGVDKEQSRYSLLHKLVRSDGLGDWVQSLDEALFGPASQHLANGFHRDRNELTERFGPGTWQYSAIESLWAAAALVLNEQEAPPTKISLKSWFAKFVEIRNKTRGHGATNIATCIKMAPQLKSSLDTIVSSLSLFQHPVAFLHRNLSGKYRVVPLGGKPDVFLPLKSNSDLTGPQSRHLDEGIYLYVDDFLPLTLLFTDADCADFFFPNGQLKGLHFESLSYLSDSRIFRDATPYLKVAKDRPASETHGGSDIEIVGSSLSNIPPTLSEYVNRQELEDELVRKLQDDRHPVVSLRGRGGIGKTSLALQVVHKLALSGTFQLIVWFSARDIDLTPDGPKLVRPHVLTKQDIANEYSRLVGPQGIHKSQKPEAFLTIEMSTPDTSSRKLFIFDNFETVRNPGDVYNWLNNSIRSPNKILITTRHNEFKADYPIEVPGMSESESASLIEIVARRLGIGHLITSDFKRDLTEEADGHPYIIKVLLGDVSKNGKVTKFERIVADKNDILDALFERTFSGLSPSSKRVFLTLCRWRSLVPSVAVKAILLRATNERMDVEASIDELVRSSFVDRIIGADGAEFLGVAIAASIFGTKKLSLSPYRAAIEADVELLRLFGATTRIDLRAGAGIRIGRMFRNIALSLSRRKDAKEFLDSVYPSLELICRSVPEAWLKLCELFEEFYPGDAEKKTIEFLERYTEAVGPDQTSLEVWMKLHRLYKATNNFLGAGQALLHACSKDGVDFLILSNSAFWFNYQIKEQKTAPGGTDHAEWSVLVKELIQLMEARVNEANATDLSRLAWLHLIVGGSGQLGPRRASELAEMGLDLDPANEHCRKIAARLDQRP